MDISLPVLIGAALVDSINPCAIAVLILLIVYLLGIAKNKGRMLLAGVIYISAVYITYLLAGLGLLSAIHATGLSYYVYPIAAGVAIITGLICVGDAVFRRKEFTLKIPKSRQPAIKKWARKATLPAAFVLGVLVSAFELPCTGAVYLAILAMLSSASWPVAFGYLLLYNFFFVLPLLVILGLAYQGVAAESLNRWRQKHSHLMKLVLGLVLLGLGVWMLLVM